MADAIKAQQTGEPAMSQETIDALSRGDITPAQYWGRHVEPWTLISSATPLSEVDEMYLDLADVASDLSDLFARVA
jgi:hypothetical protein